MDKKESFYWDLVKGTAIFLMLWGHCIQYCGLDTIDCFEDTVFKMIYSFHMPVFMLVSGYLFSYSFGRRNLVDLLEHKIRGMLHPIIMATFLNNVLMLLPRYILSDQLDFLFGRLFVGVGNDLWFLWAVLYCSLIVAVCYNLAKKPCVQWLMVALGSAITLLLPQWNMTFFMYPYFSLGFFCGMYRKNAIRVYNVLKYIAWVVFPVMVAFYETKHYIYITPMFSEEIELSASVEITLFRCTIGFVGSIWWLSVVELMLHLCGRIPAMQSCMSAVSNWGRNSLQIYCLSVPLIYGYVRNVYRKFVELVGGNLFAQNILVYDFLFTPILAVVCAVFLSGFVVLMKKYKLHKLIFGR